MVLGSTDPTITYAQTLYHAAKGCSIRYIPGSLNIDPSGWDEADNLFLADLFGLTYERLLPSPQANLTEVWMEYLDRIWNALSRNSAVQICQGWMNITENEDGELIGPDGTELIWWEGMQNRPDMHYLVATGMDKTSAQPSVYVNDPIGGWYGTGKDILVPPARFILMIQRCQVPQHQYITIAYYPPSSPRMRPVGFDPDALTRQRIRDKIAGAAAAYESPELWQEFFGAQWQGQISYGIAGLQALKTDLEENNFQRILAAKEAENYPPLDAVSYLDLGIYHYANIVAIGAEYLEEREYMDEWEWHLRLHILYNRLWIATSHIRSIFKRYYLNTRGGRNRLANAMAEAAAHLYDMRVIIDEMIAHLEQYAPQFL
jgi:hypothetical protein